MVLEHFFSVQCQENHLNDGNRKCIMYDNWPTLRNWDMTCDCTGHCFVYVVSVKNISVLSLYYHELSKTCLMFDVNRGNIQHSLGLLLI